MLSTVDRIIETSYIHTTDWIFVEIIPPESAVFYAQSNQPQTKQANTTNQNYFVQNSAQNSIIIIGRWCQTMVAIESRQRSKVVGIKLFVRNRSCHLYQLNLSQHNVFLGKITSSLQVVNQFVTPANRNAFQFRAEKERERMLSLFLW